MVPLLYQSQNLIDYDFRKRRKSRFWSRWLCLLFAISVIVYFIRAIQQTQCSEDEARSALHTLCTQYNANEVTGSFCRDLCSGDVTHKECMNYAGGKIVLRSEWKDRDIIIKSKHASIESFDSPGYIDELTGIQHLPAPLSFCGMVLDSIRINTGISLGSEDCESIRHLWVGNISFLSQNPNVEEPHSKSHIAFYTSLWSLVQQDEFVLMKMLRNSFIPDVYGSCGHFYAVEYAPTGNALSPGLFRVTFSDSPWNTRGRYALKFLDLIDSLESDSVETLHICDMKTDNFGISEKGILKIIDLDMTFVDSRIGEIVAGRVNCSQHSDCGFFDCHGWCDLSTMMCSPVRLNNNLQAVCDKLFTSQAKNGFQGLLRQIPKHAQLHLEPLLRDCASPSLSSDQSKELPGCPNIAQQSGHSSCSNAATSQLKFKADRNMLEKLYKAIARAISPEKK